MSVRIRLMTCGWLEADKSLLVAGESGRIRLPIPSVLIEHPGGLALFDTGLHADLRHDPSRMGNKPGAGAGDSRALIKALREAKGRSELRQ